MISLIIFTCSDSLNNLLLECFIHLLLGEAEGGSDLDSPQPAEVHVDSELPLQLQELRGGEGGPDALGGGEVVQV